MTTEKDQEKDQPAPVRMELIHLDDEGATFQDEHGVTRQWFTRSIWDDLGKPLILGITTTYESHSVQVIR